MLMFIFNALIQFFLLQEVTLKIESEKDDVIFKAAFNINRFLFYFAHYQAPCSFQHVILGNHVLFVPMTIIR